MGSEVWEWELRKLRGRQEERRAGTEALGNEDPAVPTHALFPGICRRGVWERFSFVFRLKSSLVHIYSFSGQVWAEGKGELETSGHV